MMDMGRVAISRLENFAPLPEVVSWAGSRGAAPEENFGAKPALPLSPTKEREDAKGAPKQNFTGSVLWRTEVTTVVHASCVHSSGGQHAEPGRMATALCCRIVENHPVESRLSLSGFDTSQYID